MKEHYESLGLDPDATPAQIKSAYHAKLREFPAHSHPEEFKAVRQAYETLRQRRPNQGSDFFRPPPIKATIPQELLGSLRQRALAQVEVSWDDLIRLTF